MRQGFIEANILVSVVLPVVVACAASVGAGVGFLADPLALGVVLYA